MKWTDLKLRLRALISPQRMERELDDELSFHLEMQTRKNLAAGMNELDARREARIQFGAGDSVAEECRDQRRVGFVETLWQDIRYALRGFRQTPLFALTVVATIAIGLGWNTAAFTLFNAYVLRPIAVPDPYSVYGMRWQDATGHALTFTWLQALEFQTNHPAFSEAAIIERQNSRMNGRHASGLLVSGNYFQMIGVHTRIGRAILPDDADKPGSAPVMVLSYAAWQNQFGGALDVLGKRVLVDGHPLEVIGVMDESFIGFEVQTVDYWAPITMAGIFDGVDVFGPAQIPRFDIFGRLERGIGEKQALAILTPWILRRMPDRSAAYLYSEATLIPLNPRIMIAMLPIMVAFVLVLLSACANVANMTLARAMSRQREIGIRLSLGAPRQRLIRQLLTESVLLSVPAAAAGFWIAQGIVAMGVRTIFATIPREFAEYIRVAPLSPDWRVFGFMIVVAILSAVLFGLAPALQATGMNVMQAARGDFSSEYRPTRLRNALVITQVTICALLLICTGVLLRGAHHVAYLDTGMDTRPVVQIKIREKARQKVLDQLAAEPVVELVAASSDPLLTSFPTAGVSIVGVSGDGLQRLPKAQYSFVSPQFFDVLAIPITAGRNFTPGETSVALVSQTAARQLFPNQDPLGQTIQLAGDRLPHPVSASIIGIARDTNAGWAGDDPDRTLIYLPSSVNTADTVLLVRVKGDTEAARQRLDLTLDSGETGAVTQIHKMQEFAAGRIYPYQAAYWVSASVGVLALLLTLSGIYGVLSYVVAQRTKEIGIRMAIGANRWTLVRMILRQSLKLAGIGTLTGALLAFGTARVLAFALVGVNVYDAVPYITGVLVVLAACVCAAYFPARRAAGVNPTVTLRYD